MESHPENLTIGAFAKETGVSVETIRFYQRKGLLPEPRKPRGGIRRYGENDVARLRFVKSSQALGFTLEEVGGLLHLDDGAHCDEARVLAEKKLADVRAKLSDLRRIESALAKHVEDCCGRRGTLCCPLIVALQRH